MGAGSCGCGTDSGGPCQVCDRRWVWTSVPAYGTQVRTLSHNVVRQTASGIARSALLKADPQLPKDPP